MLQRNLGFEDGKVGGAGAASAWVINSLATPDTIAGYPADGGNLLGGSDDLDNTTYWTLLHLANLLTELADPGPPGAVVRAWLLTDSTAAQAHGIVQTVATFTGLPTAHAVVASVWARKVDGGPVDFLRLEFEGDEAWFDLAAGAVGTVTNTTGFAAASIVDEGDGWYRCILVSRRSGAFTFTVASAAVDGAASYTGTAVSVLHLYGPQLNVGSAVSQFLVTPAAGVLRESPCETFDTLWQENDGYVEDLAAAGASAATYTSGLVPASSFDSFEELWQSNEGYLFALGPASSAVYVGPKNVEDYEDNWPVGASYFFDLATAGSTAADYDPGGGTQLFDNFGDAIPANWNGGVAYFVDWVAVLAGPGATAASYDVGAPEPVEDFEEEWPTLIMTTF